MVINKLQALVHKDGVNKEDWNNVHPNLLLLGEFLIDHCEEHQLPIVVTSIIRDKLSISKTDIHSKGRAFDISVRGWSKEDIEYLVKKMNDHFKIGAISARDFQEREVVFEDAEFNEEGDQTKWPHFHFQVRS